MYISLSNSTSQPATLQLRAFQSLVKHPEKLEELRQMPGLKSIMQSYWFLAPPVRYSRSSTDHELDLGDEAVLSSSKLRLGRKQKYRGELIGSLHTISEQCISYAINKFTRSFSST